MGRGRERYTPKGDIPLFSPCLPNRVFRLMARKERDKGIRGELEVRDIFRRYGFKAERGQQHSGSPDSPDVKTSLDYWLHVEVKRVEAFSLYPSLAQAAEDAGLLHVPVVFHRRSGKRWVVVLDAEDFMDLVKMKEGGTNG